MWRAEKVNEKQQELRTDGDNTKLRGTNNHYESTGGREGRCKITEGYVIKGKQRKKLFVSDK